MCERIQFTIVAKERNEEINIVSDLILNLIFIILVCILIKKRKLFSVFAFVLSVHRLLYRLDKRGLLLLVSRYATVKRHPE